MTKLRGVVEHITYQNPENGWSVMKVKVKDYKDPVTLTGSLLDVPVGSVLSARDNGRWDAPLRPAVCRGVVEGVQPATYIRYREVSWQRTGQGYRSGIRPRNRVKIRLRLSMSSRTTSSGCWKCAASRAQTNGENPQSWEKQKDIKEVMVFLQGYGVSTAYAAKIYRQYQKDSIKTVKENPYQLADDIWESGSRPPIP